MPIENCRRCNRVFKKNVSPYCPDCHQNQMVNFDVVYQYLQQHEHHAVHLNDIAQNCGMTVKDVEDIFFSGRLGMAGSRVAYNCQMCDVAITPKNKGRRRLCAQCSVTVEIEGKLHLTSHEELLRKEKELASAQRDEHYQQVAEQRITQAKEIIEEKPAPPAPSPSPMQETRSDNQFGFKRLSAP